MEEYNAESTTFVSVNICGIYTYVQLKQIFNDKINPNGIFLTSSDFGSLMFQLKAIENKLLLSGKQEPSSDVDTTIQFSVDTTKPKDKQKRKLVKKETICKKIKKEEANENDIMKAYAKLLPNLIEGLIKTRCFGCMLNLDASSGAHDICIDRQLYIEQCFVEAMSLVDQAKVAELVNNENIPSLNELIVDSAWCNSLKIMLNVGNI